MSNDRKELVDWVRGIYQNLDDADKRDALRFFPELRESEDERIKKEIIKFIQDFCNPCDPDCDKWIAYLEKQEQKPSEKQDYSGLTDFERAIHRGFLCAGVENIPVTIIKETAQDCLAHLPAEWSEEDFEKLVGDLVQDVVANERDAANYGDEKKSTSFFVKKYLERLKSLRPSWKPSEEQTEALSRAIPVILNGLGKDHARRPESLRNDLLKQK